MWTDKSHFLTTEYKQHFLTPTQQESGEIAGVPARLIKSTGKSMPKPIERSEKRATGKKSIPIPIERSEKRATGKKTITSSQRTA
jgi:hypothetical protein